MSHHKRALHWRECRNVRDLGGLPASAGGRTRPEVLIRADTLDRLSHQGVMSVKDAGVARIVDLRSPHEISGQEHPFHGDSIYRMVSFIDERRDHERDPEAEQTLADLYRGSVDRNGRRIAAAVTAIASAPDGAVVVHCAAGKDRTGMLVALVLDVVGVPRSVIAEDYAVSEGRLENATSPDDGSRDPKKREMRRARPATILETLDHVDRQHGGAEAYLSASGVSATQIDELRSRLVLRAR